MEQSTAAQPPAKRRRMAPQNSGRLDDAYAAQGQNQPKEVANPLPGSLREDGDSLDLSVFLDALRYEVGDLHVSMKASRDSKSEKAFQSVPRSLRRRTASHDAKRLPRRLRSQARRDQVADNTPSPAVGRAKRKNARPASAWVHDNTRKRIRLQEEKKLARHVAMAQNGVDMAHADVDDVEEDGIEEDEDEGEDADEDGHNEGPSEDDEAMDLDDAARADDGQDGVEVDEDGAGQGSAQSPTYLKEAALIPHTETLRLPTHTWHAKRAHMARPGALWHTFIVKSPSNKTYRQALRTAGMSQNMCLAWDTSYMAVIRLRAEVQDQMDAALAAVVEPHLITPAIHSGAQSVDVKLPRDFHYQIRQQKDQRQLGEMGGPGNCGAMTLFFNPSREEDGSSGSATNSTIQAFLRVHPVIFSHVWTVLVNTVKTQKLRVAVHDFRLEVGSVDVTGASGLEAILGALYPYESKKAPMEPQAADFLQLRTMDTTALPLASGAMLSFHIQDPRLDEPDQPGPLPAGSGNARLADWPENKRGRPSGLFDDAVRQRATQLQTQSTLDSRRGKLSVGSKLLVGVNNHPIPIILASVGSSVPVAANPHSQQQPTSSATWTLLAPRACIDAIWRCLSRQGLRSGQQPRFAGLDEAQHVSLERGRPFFPQDFPGTPAGWDWELQNRNRLARAWSQKPPAKRPAWALLDLRNGSKKGEVGFGHACDWEHLFGADAVSRDLAVDSSSSSSQNEDEDVQFETLRPASMPDLVRNMHHVTWADVRLAVGSVRLAQRQLSLSAFSWSCPYPLLTISIQMLARGVPTNCARIYRLPAATDDGHGKSLRKQWCDKAEDSSSHHNHRGNSSHAPTPKRMPRGASMALRKKLLAASLLEAKLPYPKDPDMRQHPNERHLPVPDESDLIGFVTSGAHRFQTGRGFGIGHVHAQKLVEAIVAADGEREAASNRPADGTTSGPSPSHGPVSTSKEARFCIVRNAGESVGWLARWTPISN